MANPYNKEFRQQNFGQLKKDLQSKNPKVVAKALVKAALDHNPTAIASRALGFKPQNQMERNIGRIPGVNLGYAAQKKLGNLVNGTKEGFAQIGKDIAPKVAREISKMKADLKKNGLGQFMDKLKKPS